jgi:hypothetical protein
MPMDVSPGDRDKLTATVNLAAINLGVTEAYRLLSQPATR